MHSSVSIILDQKIQSVLLLERANHIKHANEICLPGGFVDTKDGSALNAAIRETHEETGIDLNQCSINEAKLLGKFVTSYGNEIHAYFFRVTQFPDIVLSDESSSYLMLPLIHLKNKNNYRYNFTARMHFLSLEFAGKAIWGVTASILFAFADFIKVCAVDSCGGYT